MANPQVLCARETNPAPCSRDPSDFQLLDCFIVHRDEASFATLVQRYAGTVWRVCRRVLRQDQDAEDAFQAVFFLLARKATSIRKPEAVGSWLYGVAYRTAMRAKRSTNRRQEQEQQAAEAMPEQPPGNQAAFRELQQILDEEVHRLGEKYRVPFVLCCLEGLTKAEAARELGWKEGTVSGRVTRARQQLQKRLARRGVTLSAVLTAVTLTQNLASASAPPLLLHTTVEALAGKAAASLSPKVVALGNALLHSIVAAKIKAALAVVLALTTLLAGAGLAHHLAMDADAPADPPVALADPELFVPPPIPFLKAIDEQVLALAFSPDDKRLVTAGARHTLPGQLMMWDVASASEMVKSRVFRGIRAVAFSADGQFLACGHFFGAITLRDPHTGAVRAELKGHTRGVNGLAFSADSKWLVSAGLDRVVKLWDLQTLKEIKSFSGHTAMVFSAAFFRHGQAFVTCGQDQTARIWDLTTGKEKFILQGHSASVEMVAISPDDKLVATAGWDGAIKFWDGQTGKETADLGGHESSVLAIAFSPDGALLASATEDGKLSLWNVKTRKKVASLGQHASAIWTLAFSHDGRLLASGSSDKTAKLWNVTTLKEMATLRTSELQPVTALAYAPDGKVVAIATEDKVVQLRDAQTGNLLFNLKGHDGTVNCLDFSPDGQTLASGSTDNTVKLWEWTKGKETRSLKGHVGAVYALAFSPDGKRLASGGDKTIKVWDASSGAELAVFQGHVAPIRALAFATNGFTLASGGTDNTIRLWHLDNESKPSALQAHEKAVRALAFSGALLASASDDGTVKVWTPAPGKLWMPAEGKKPLLLKGHAGAVSSVAFGRSGRTLVSGGEDGNVILWDPVSGQSRGVLRGHRQPVTTLAIHPQGWDLLSGSLDAQVLRWLDARGTRGPVVESNFPQPGGKETKQASGIEVAPKPRESYAKEFYHDFRGRPLPAELAFFDDTEFIHQEAEGLRITIPKNRKKGDGASVGTTFLLRGDFEITSTFEILTAETPPPSYGVGVTLLVRAMEPSRKTAAVCRLARSNGRQVASWDRSFDELDSEGKPRTEGGASVCVEKVGRLRLRRVKSVLFFSWAPGTNGGEFTQIHQSEFGTEDIGRVLVSGVTGRRPCDLDIRILDLRIRGGEAAEAAAIDVELEHGFWKTWLALGLVTVLLLGAGLAIYSGWHRSGLPVTVSAPVERAGAKEETPFVSVVCSDCGKNLKVRKELAGKKVKCPGCGVAVRVPG
jgi:RNA polymerase sigma factor (sigma-70 family)